MMTNKKELLRAPTTRESSETLTHATTTEGRTMPNEQGYSADAMCVCGHARGCHIGGSIDCVDCECTIYAKEPIPDGAETEPRLFDVSDAQDYIQRRVEVAETEPRPTYIREQDEKAFTHLLEKDKDHGAALLPADQSAPVQTKPLPNIGDTVKYDHLGAIWTDEVTAVRGDWFWTKNHGKALHRRALVNR